MKDEYGKAAIFATMAAHLLVDMARSVNATESSIELKKATYKGELIGNWEVKIVRQPDTTMAAADTSTPALSPDEKALRYYRSASEGKRPDYVPSRIRLPRAVHGDFPFHGVLADAGEHACECNQWGAVSVLASDGRLLGVKPAEFEPLEWRKNALATEDNTTGHETST